MTAEVCGVNAGARSRSAAQDENGARAGEGPRAARASKSPVYLQLLGSPSLHTLDRQPAGLMHFGPAVVSHVAPSAADAMHVPVVPPESLQKPLEIHTA